MTTKDIEKEIEYAQDHPFQVVRFEKGGNGWLIVSGDPIVISNGLRVKKLVLTNVSWEEKIKKESQFEIQVKSMKDYYQKNTGTDGVKVNWEPVIFQEDV